MSAKQDIKILVVDDDVALLKLIALRLKAAGYITECANSGEQALTMIAKWPANLVITDLQMPGMSGIDLFEKLHQQNPLLPVIILTAHGTIPDAVAATQAGVFSYLTKPFDSQVLLKHIETALKNVTNTPNKETSKPKNTSIQSSTAWRSNIITQNAKMVKLCQQIEKIAPTKANVLINGQSGTGKELIARSIHEASQRPGSFIIVNCSDLSNKIEATHFTIAQTGTLFLNEVSDLSPAAQKDLLLMLQRYKKESANGKAVRILSSTQIDLDQAVKNYTFRADLLYRLNATTLILPTLEERKDDILMIVNDWLNQREEFKQFKLSRKSAQLLIKTKWPGNIRQLLHVVEQCCVLSSTNIISETLLASVLGNPSNNIQPLSTAHADFERDYIINLLKLTKGNVTHAADLAKRNRTEFHRLLKKHQIEAKLFR